MSPEHSLEKQGFQPDPYPQIKKTFVLMQACIVCLAIVLIFASCETISISETKDNRFVVQAYLHAGEPVTDIRLTSTLPLGSEESTAPPINDAQITLIKNGERYSLVPTPGGNGYYHYPDDNLVVETGDVFDFEATVDGTTATARTTVPPFPDEVSLSPAQVQVVGYWPAQPINVQWPNPQRHWYFITHINIEPEPRLIFDGTIVLRPSLEVSEPTDADFKEIATYSMRYYGRYKVNVYRVNEEYLQLYLSRKQDSRDLNEPATNINNGLGIFTAFSGKPAYFEVTQ